MPSPSRWPRIVGLTTAAAVIIVPVFTRTIIKATNEAVSDIDIASATDDDDLPVITNPAPTNDNSDTLLSLRD